MERTLNPNPTPVATPGKASPPSQRRSHAKIHRYVRDFKVVLICLFVQTYLSLGENGPFLIDEQIGFRLVPSNTYLAQQICTVYEWALFGLLVFGFSYLLLRSLDFQNRKPFRFSLLGLIVGTTACAVMFAICIADVQWKLGGWREPESDTIGLFDDFFDDLKFGLWSLPRYIKWPFAAAIWCGLFAILSFPFAFLNAKEKPKSQSVSGY